MEVVLNWLTQGAVVAIAAAAALRVIPPARPRTRYGFVWATLLLVLALPAVPLVLGAAGALPASAIALSPPPAATIPAAWWTSPALALALWVMWSGACAFRLVRGVVALARVRRSGRECPPDLQSRLHHWSRMSAGGRRARVVLSASVRSASVLGCGPPIIALSPSLVAQLSDNDLDRVVIHEWAHVQRGDDLAQLAQRLVHVFVGWHPAAWWLERQLELEREAACDAIAVAVTGSAKGYATCLATVAALPVVALRALPALNAASRSGLRCRVVRVLSARPDATAQTWSPVAVAAGVGLVVLALAVGNVDVVVSAGTSSPPSAAVRPTPAAIRPTNVRATVRPVAPIASSSSAGLADNLGSRRTVRPAIREHHTFRAAARPRTIENPPDVVIASVPLESSGWRLDPPTTAPAATRVQEELDVLAETHSAPLSATTQPSAPERTAAPWTAAADAGVAIGRVSQRAGVAGAGFFRRVGTRVARSF